MDKHCTNCATTKPVADFTLKSSSPDGYSRYCRDCQRAKRAARPKTSRPRKGAAVRTIIPVLDHVASEALPVSSAVEDYVPSPELKGVWVAVQRLVKRGRAAANLLFVGPSGSGKTEGAKHLAFVAGLAFTQVDAPAHTDPESWFGKRDIVEQNGVPVTIVTDSAFVAALQRPGVLLIDEVNRVSDAIRNILLALLDGTRAVTNPLTGQPLVRHPECYIVMTGNVGLGFTGTYAIDPALFTRSLTTNFSYLAAPEETALLISRTGVASEVATMLVRFANETRDRARDDEDFPPVSTRELLAAADLVSVGLDANTAAHEAIINAAPGEGGGESIRAKLEYIWNGIRPK